MTKEITILVNHASFQISRVEKNVLIVHHKKGVITKEIFLQIESFIRDISLNTIGIYVLNTQDRGFSFDNEAWRYIQSEAHKFTFIKAQALVAELLHFRILAKFHIKMSRKRSQTVFKIVADVQDGIDWLNQRVEIDNNSRPQ